MAGHSSGSVELRPLIPQRLSSLEVLERLNSMDGGSEGGDRDSLTNGEGLDANGNLLQLRAARRRGGYLHTFTSVTSLLPLLLHMCPSLWSLILCLTFLSHCVPFPPQNNGATVHL